LLLYNGKTLTEWGSIALSKDTCPNRAPECVGAQCSQGARQTGVGVGGGGVSGASAQAYIYKAGGVGRLKAQSGRVVLYTDMPMGRVDGVVD
jgi:hypothetical protein